MYYDAYMVGRKEEILQEPYSGVDKVYGGTRLDQKDMQKAEFNHCTFANISFKESKIADSHFTNCVFIGCYFRRSILVSTSFQGCRFIDCEFPKVSVRSCDFRYAKFSGCYIPFGELEHSLPSEPNLREVLARNLTLEAGKLGLASETRYYRMAEIKAHEQHLAAAVKGRSQWYQEHFNISARLMAGIKLTSSLLNRWLWGYGERSFVLIRNILAAALLIFPIAFYVLQDQLASPYDPISVSDIVYFSLANIIPTGISSSVTAVGPWAKMFAGLESVFGVVTSGLLAAYIFRWSLHR